LTAIAEEHADIKKKIFKAEHAFTTNEHYDEILADAVTTFIAHAEEEETIQHPKLRENMTPEENDVSSCSVLFLFRRFTHRDYTARCAGVLEGTDSGAETAASAYPADRRDGAEGDGYAWACARHGTVSSLTYLALDR
jgi:hypothetical protein